MANPANVFGPWPFQLFTNDVVMQEGDSTGALDGDSQLLVAVKRRLFNAAFGSAVQPKWWNNAVSSTGMDTQLGRIMANFAKNGIPTKFIWAPGIFDVIGGGHAIGTINDTTNTTWCGMFRLVTDLVAGFFGVPMYISGPHLIGEKWPSGQNTVAGHDADLDALDAAMITLSARYPTLITYRSMRGTYAFNESLLNLPAPGVESGPLTQPDSQKCHYNPGGRNVIDAYYKLDITISVSTSYRTRRATYTSTTPPNTSSLRSIHDANALAGGNGSNQTTFPNGPLGLGGTRWDYVTTPATKPTLAVPGDGTKINGAQALVTAGAAWMRTISGTRLALPQVTVLVFKPTNFATTMIWDDGFVDTAPQEPYLATLAGSGTVQTNAGVAKNDVAISAAQWHTIILFWYGDPLSGGATFNSPSFSVIDGRVQTYGDNGTTGPSGQTLFANAGNASICNGSMTLRACWGAELGPLPDWRDVWDWVQNVRGRTPQ